MAYLFAIKCTSISTSSNEVIRLASACADERSPRYPVDIGIAPPCLLTAKLKTHRDKGHTYRGYSVYDTPTYSHSIVLSHRNALI